MIKEIRRSIYESMANYYRTRVEKTTYELRLEEAKVEKLRKRMNKMIERRTGLLTKIQNLEGAGN